MRNSVQGFSLSSLDLKNKEIQKDSESNKHNTPLPLVTLDKISTYTSSSVGISVAKRTAAYKQAIAPDGSYSRIGSRQSR